MCSRPIIKCVLEILDRFIAADQKGWVNSKRGFERILWLHSQQFRAAPL